MGPLRASFAETRDEMGSQDETVSSGTLKMGIKQGIRRSNYSPKTGRLQLFTLRRTPLIN
jgi:hypothetical protein